jgi:hypothetical protein
MVNFFVLGLSLLCSLSALGLALHAAARIARISKSTKDLDWAAVANLTGDIGSVRSTIQKLNNRINGMERVKGGTQADALNEIAEARARRSNNNVTFGASG